MPATLATGGVGAPLDLLAVLGTTASTTAIGATVTSAATSLALSVGASLASQVLFAPKLEKSRQAGGLQLDASLDPARPRSVLVGTVPTAGSLIDLRTSDAGAGGALDPANRIAHWVIALADHECDGIEAVIIDGQTVTVGNNEGPGLPVLERRRDSSNDHIWYRTWLNGGADSYLVSEIGNNNRWSSAMVGTGVCRARVTAKWNPPTVDRVPDWRFVVRGAKLYDPRKDGTNGGAGAHRWTDAATWGYSANPAVIAYNILRGRFAMAPLYWGSDRPAVAFDNSAWFAAMNACDEDVALKAGGTEKRYRMHAEFLVDIEPIRAVQACAQAMAGQVYEVGGLWKCHAGVAKVAVGDLYDEDILSLEPAEDVPQPGFDQTINTIHATWTDPAALYEERASPVRSSTVDVSTDGARRLEDRLELPYVQSGTQAQRIAEIRRRLARLQHVHTMVASPRLLQFEPGDVIRFTSVRYGYTNRLFEIAAQEIRPDLTIGLTLQEYATSTYEWVAATDQLDDVGGDLISAEPGDPDPVEVVDTLARAALLPGTAPTAGAFGAVAIAVGDLQERVAELHARVFDTLAAVRSGDTTIEAAVSATRADLGATATALEVLEASVTAIDDVVAAQAQQLVTLQNAVDDPATGLGATAGAVDALGTRVTSAEGDIAAVAVRTAALEAEIDDPVSGLAATAGAVEAVRADVEAIDGVVTAQASQITEVSTAVGDTSAGGLFSMQAVSAPGAAVSELRMAVRTTVGGAANQVGILLRGDGPNSKIILDGNTVVRGELIAEGTISAPAIVQNSLVFTRAISAENALQGLARVGEPLNQLNNYGTILTLPFIGDAGRLDVRYSFATRQIQIPETIAPYLSSRDVWRFWVAIFRGNVFLDRVQVIPSSIRQDKRGNQNNQDFTVLNVFYSDVLSLNVGTGAADVRLAVTLQCDSGATTNWLNGTNTNANGADLFRVFQRRLSATLTRISN